MVCAAGEMHPHLSRARDQGQRLRTEDMPPASACGLCRGFMLRFLQNVQREHAGGEMVKSGFCIAFFLPIPNKGDSSTSRAP